MIFIISIDDRGRQRRNRDLDVLLGFTHVDIPILVVVGAGGRVIAALCSFATTVSLISKKPRRADLGISILREGAAGLVNKRESGRHVVIFKTCDDPLDLCEGLSAGIINLQDTVDSVKLDKEIEKKAGLGKA